jgi:hypothetical protein
MNGTLGREEAAKGRSVDSLLARTRLEFLRSGVVPVPAESLTLARVLPSLRTVVRVDRAVGLIRGALDRLPLS